MNEARRIYLHEARDQHALCRTLERHDAHYRAPSERGLLRPQRHSRASGCPVPHWLERVWNAIVTTSFTTRRELELYTSSMGVIVEQHGRLAMAHEAIHALDLLYQQYATVEAERCAAVLESLWRLGGIPGIARPLLRRIALGELPR